MNVEVLKKVPPHSPEAEKIILGSILLNNDFLTLVTNFLSPEEFYREGNRKILETMSEMGRDGIPIEILSVAEEMRRRGTLEEIGGAAYLASLTDGLMKNTRVDYYCTLVKEKFILRKMITDSWRSVSDCYEEKGTPREILESIKTNSARTERLFPVERGVVGPKIQESVLSLTEEMKYVERIRLGFPMLDKNSRGFRRGELVVFMARPGVGKTFALMNSLHYLAAERKKTAFFSLEMPSPSVMERIIQIHFDVSLDAVTREFIEFNVGDDFDLFWETVDFNYGVLSVSEISAAIEKYGSEVAFIDYAGLIKAESRVSSYERVSRVMLDLKEMAKNRNCLVVLAYQLSRQAEDGSAPVLLNHARDSGQVEEVSDFVAGAWRPGLSDELMENHRVIVFRILKNKRGALGTENYILTKSGRVRAVEKDLS